MQPNMDNNIRVECLPPGEAFNLFEEKVGSETFRMHPDICKLAEAVVEECAGLPLALITIGRAHGIQEDPSRMGICYRSFKAISSFCVARDYSIVKDELVDCWIGGGLLDEHTNLNNARNQGHFIIGSLIDACLLGKGPINVDVKMHDLIRDMALWIAGESENEKFFAKSGVQLKEQPKAKKWEEVTRMSLMENQIENLTEILECPNLQTLFLGRNDLKVIMGDFFNFMPMLRVLDLSLNKKLEELPVGIAKLVSLEHLNLSWTGIKKLPVELKTLAKLKYLNLEWTADLKMIPQQLISSFSKLQVLKMEGCGYGCLLVLEEIEHLKYLNVLTLTFRCVSELEKASRFNKFFSCAIEAVNLEDFRDSRSLNIMALAKLQHLCVLSLSSCMDLEEVKIERNIIEGAGCFHSLRSVTLSGCNHLRAVS
ncbi:probable disease resistance protein At1g15890 isoform X2 [Gossypium raimondii]|uniref:probable disease resistance protein At1g15890 isoform X2 n=1 Tax=Gossypium raimondii TaxID=29730 RepID=UPI00227D5824|nr:probable disease resistance protein At1g15890 isoform X2 [Gossypium raimondii]